MRESCEWGVCSPMNTSTLNPAGKPAAPEAPARLPPLPPAPPAGTPALPPKPALPAGLPPAPAEPALLALAPLTPGAPAPISAMPPVPAEPLLDAGVGSLPHADANASTARAELTRSNQASQPSGAVAGVAERRVVEAQEIEQRDEQIAVGAV